MKMNNSLRQFLCFQLSNASENPTQAELFMECAIGAIHYEIFLGHNIPDGIEKSWKNKFMKIISERDNNNES